ncbi:MULTISPECIES: transposase [unclassified Bradyrhizobium]|uniref:transposase n=1 Tax=unclassified Bradyrhizobium TaxID=2631580 RepID=UPI0035C6CA3C
MIHGWSALEGLTMAGWEDELEPWLMPFLDRLGHKTRQRMCPLYVAGLIGPGDRKSVQPMAERLASGNYDQLPPFHCGRCLGRDAAGDGAAQPGGPTCRRQGCDAGYR